MKRKFYQINNKTFSELGVGSYQEMWEKVKNEHSGLSVQSAVEFKKLKSADNRFRVVMSTEDQDRHGEVVKQNWDLKSFKKNPVFLDSHNYDSIEHILGRVEKVKVKDNALQGVVEFNTESPKGVLAMKMAENGFLNATSVGFIPQEFNEKGDIEKSELLELSAVSVPSNAEALFEKSIEEIEAEIKNGSVEQDNPSPTLPNSGESSEKSQKSDTTGVGERRYSKVDAMRKLRKQIEKREEKRKELLKESLAVIRQLSEQRLGASSRKQKVNRVIRQLLKAKEL